MGDQLSQEQRRVFKELYGEISEGCKEAARQTESMKRRSKLRMVPIYMALIEPVLKQFWLEGALSKQTGIMEVQDGN